MIILNDDQIFDRDGEILNTNVAVALTETLLVIIQASNGKPITNAQINLELRRCGFFIRNEQIVLILSKLQKEGLVQLEGNNSKPSDKPKSNE
jgi:repressor of nif and glnA expression